MIAKTITLQGGRQIGGNAMPFIAAEIGINHNGDIELGKKMIRAAAETGACSVKFQNYRTEDFIHDYSLTHTYMSQGVEVTESQYTLFKRCELTRAMLLELRKEADACGVIFFSTPTSEATIEDAVAAGVPLLKNGSDYLGNLPLIRAMGRSGLPTVLSTGMACLSDIEDAVTAFEEGGGKDLILLHCISSYPTPPTEVNLKKMASLQSTFGTLVGFSDHTEGIAAAVSAVALGACMIEKHFTSDRHLPGPDHWFSSDPAEFKELVKNCRNAKLALGSGVLQATPLEAANRKSFRLSCVAAAGLKPGHTIRVEDVSFARPGHGYPPKSVDEILGRTLRVAVQPGHVLTKEDFQ